MTKTFLTYEQQLHKLKEDKHLSIFDINFAITTLKEISYYSLIGGYKDLFKHKPSQKFIRGVSFEEIVSFYYFDEELRSLFFKYILHVERHIKSTISYHFCNKHGINQSSYIDINNFNCSKRNISEVHKLISSIQKTISTPSSYKYINHYATVHQNIPLWVTMNAMTFGQVSKFYQYTTSSIRSCVSKDFDNISETQLHQLITILARCRNICAHNERLYSFHIRETIPNMPLHQKMNIKMKNGNYTQGKQDLFAVVIALRYLLTTQDFKVFKASLTRLINKTLIKCPHIKPSQLYREMGFPDNWNKITRYKK